MASTTLLPREQLEDRLVLVRVELQTAPGRPSRRLVVDRVASGRRPRAALTVARGPGVGGGEDLAQVVDGDQRVDLGGGHRRVAEQLLDDADVGAAVEQVGGEGVPQRVRRDVAGHPGPLGGLDQHRPGGLAREPAAAGVEEQRSPGAAAGAGQLGPAAHEVGRDAPSRA